MERVATAEKKAKEDAIVRAGAKLMEVCMCFGKKLHSSDSWDNRTLQSIEAACTVVHTTGVALVAPTRCGPFT